MVNRRNLPAVTYAVTHAADEEKILFTEPVRISAQVFQNTSINRSRTAPRGRRPRLMTLVVCCIFGLSTAAVTEFCLLQESAEMTYELRPNFICNLGWYEREKSWFGRYFLFYNKHMTIEEMRATLRTVNVTPEFKDISPPKPPEIQYMSHETARPTLPPVQ